MPSAETVPQAWERWSETLDTVVCKGWGGWKLPIPTDTTRGQVALAPCMTCAQLVRVPLHETSRYAGIRENCWGWWNPRSHSTTLAPQCLEGSWKGFPTTLEDDQSYSGSGTVDSAAARSLGCPFLPDCHHMWRSEGPSRELVTRRADHIPEPFSCDGMCSLANKGDQIIRQFEGCTRQCESFRRWKCARRRTNCLSLTKTIPYSRRSIPQRWESSTRECSQCITEWWVQPRGLGVYLITFLRQLPLDLSLGNCGRTSERGGFSRALPIASSSIPR